MDINDFINSIDTKLYNRIRGSQGDAECRRYLKEHLQKQLLIHNVSNCISDNGLIELYRLAYNDGFANVGDKKDIIKHRQKQIAIIKKKYCC